MPITTVVGSIHTDLVSQMFRLCDAGETANSIDKLILKAQK